jgi:hypothetical protein
MRPVRTRIWHDSAGPANNPDEVTASHPAPRETAEARASLIAGVSLIWRKPMGRNPWTRRGSCRFMQGVSVEGRAKTRAHDPAQVAVAVWACLLAGLRFLAAGPGARSRGWRLCFRVVAAGVAAVLVTAGLAAAPARAASVTPAGSAVSVLGLGGAAGAGIAKELAAAVKGLAAVPAHAPSVTPAGSAVSVRGLGVLAGGGTAKGPAAQTATLPDTITASYDYPDYPAAKVTAAVKDWLPEMVGLTPGAPLDQVVSAIEDLWKRTNPPEGLVDPEPDELSGATVTVTSDGGTGSIVDVTAPTPSGAGTPGPDGSVNQILAGFLAQMGAFIISAGTTVVLGAYLFGLPSNDSVWDPAFENARPGLQRGLTWCASMLYGLTAGLLYYSQTKGNPPDSGPPWQTWIGNLVGGAVFGYANTYVPTYIKALQYQWLAWRLFVNLPSLSIGSPSALGWMTPYLTADQLTQMNAFLNAAYTEPALNWIRDSSSSLAQLLGLWTPVAHGYVGNVPTGGVVAVGSGDCMDAYGSNENNEPASPPAIPGQSVAINACDGNNAQVFDFWPSGQIGIYGLCMDDDGDADPSDRPVVNLQLCDGGYTQQWYENTAGEIVNAATGNCLDDPAGNTTPGTQLIAYPCNGRANQLWAPPGGTAAVTGYGQMWSVQPDGSGHDCMFPQTTLPNATGSNVITAYQTNGACRTRTNYTWAQGSNGTLMANATNPRMADGTNFLCMDGDGPATTGPGGEAANFVQLQPCDGSQSQVWHVDSTFLGPTLQNAADGRCLNTTSGYLGSSRSMVVASCASTPSSGELWTMPGVPLPSGASAGSVCDIYASGGTPCEAAYSMDRALYASYDGPLYQVTRASDNTTRNIGLLAVGGDVNAAEQDSFCAGTVCKVTKIYDQSPNHNDLTVFTAGGGAVSTPDNAADAAALPIKIGVSASDPNGTEAYGLDVENQVGYRDDGPNDKGATGIATGDQPEGMYMVASGTHVNNRCCFDFGNAETNNDDDGAGTMDAVNVSSTCYFGPCSGAGPWVEADLENGLYTGGGANPGYQGVSGNFVTAMLKNNGTSSFELESGDATSGGLTVGYDGSLPPPLPTTPPQSYTPMNKQGAIILGTGGDNSNSDQGSFFEGVMTKGYPSDATDALVQANIVAAGYSGTTTPAEAAAASPAGQAVVHSAGATGAAAAGFSSVYTVDSANGHLQESYLPYVGASWHTQDLSSTGPMLPDTPAVMPGTKPVAITHCGYTSVFTIDAGDGSHGTGDLQETFLPKIGDPIGWRTQDLSQGAPHTPPSHVTPTAVEHTAGVAGSSAGCGFTSVYTVARDGDLWETYLPIAGFPGDPWVTQDLSSTASQMPDTPEVQPGTSPVAIVHCGYTSVYTVNASNHLLQESYLPTVGDSWSTQTLPAPPTVTTPTAVMHSAGAPGGTADCGYTSVYTVDDVTQHLQETYLPNTGFPGDPWHTQDLGSTGPTLPDTPPVAPGTQPEVLVHMGYTSVYTVDEGSQHLQESFLPAIGDPIGWRTQDLTAKYNAPVTDQSPIVLEHPDPSGNLDWTSVFTIDEFNNHLKETYLPNTGFPGDAWITQDLSTTGPTLPDTPEAAVLQSQQSDYSVAHDGYTSVYTVDSNGDLQESYLSAMGKTWVTQNLTTMTSGPAVAPGTTPVAIYHDGYTSVFTHDKGSGDLQETYLPALGGPWYTHDLSSSAPGMARTPAIAKASSPTAVFHDGYLSVYTIDANGDLQETYLAQLGGNWVTQDLTTMTSGPKTLGAYSDPVAIVHDGYVSVFTEDFGGASTNPNDLQETYLPVLGGPWFTHDLSKMAGTPEVLAYTDPTVVFHDGFLSVYTVNDNSGSGYGDLEETYLPAIGDKWVSQDLTSKYGLPVVQQYSSPVALYHTGFTSVYYDAGGTKNTAPGHLIEAYLPAISDGWGWNDLSAENPPATPNLDTVTTLGGNQGAIGLAPLVHYDTSGGLTWTSVFTIDGNSDDLQETYLPAIGDKWATQNLTTENPPATPPW